MPLSEEELRLLEQMERALVAEDPKFASTLRGTRLRQRVRRNVALGVVVFVAGIALLMAGVVLTVVPLGVAGFVVMLASAYFALTSWRGQNAAPATPGPATSPSGLRVIQGGKTRRIRSRGPGAQAPKQTSKNQGSMMDRLEERWRRRRDENRGF